MLTKWQRKHSKKYRRSSTATFVWTPTLYSTKLLKCFHVYCLGCLRRLVFKDQQGQFVLTCPECRQETPIPAGGVAGLQPAFHINRLLGIMEEHKKGKESAHAENSFPVTIPTCSEHEDEEVKLYCETCEKLICLKCVIKHGKHQKHDHELLDDAFKKFKKQMRTLDGDVRVRYSNITWTLNPDVTTKVSPCIQDGKVSSREWTTLCHAYMFYMHTEYVLECVLDTEEEDTSDRSVQT